MFWLSNFKVLVPVTYVFESSALKKSIFFLTKNKRWGQSCTSVLLLDHKPSHKSWYRDLLLALNAWPSLGIFLPSSFNLKDLFLFIYYLLQHLLPFLLLYIFLSLLIHVCHLAIAWVLALGTSLIFSPVFYLIFLSLLFEPKFLVLYILSSCQSHLPFLLPRYCPFSF